MLIFMLSPQGVAVLGIALIAMGEEIGSEMALRTFGHLVSSTFCRRFSILVFLLFVFHIILSSYLLLFLTLLIYFTFSFHWVCSE